MLLLIIRVLYAIVSAGAIFAFVSKKDDLPAFVYNHPLWTFVLLLLFSQSVTVIDILVRKKRIEIISAIYFGLLVGTLLSFLAILAVTPLMIRIGLEDWSGAVQLFVPLVMSYLSISLLLQTKDDFRFVIPYVEFARDLKGGLPLVLDSSALIDGRIAEVVETRILDARMIVPGFVLKEVQDVADSSDKNRRTRGRRGLDVLARLQGMPHTEISVIDVDDPESKSMTVDQKLVKFAKSQGGRIVTNDFNLNKVASVQGVDVINLNDVAAALRPRFLPGEILRLRIQREGEGQGQGVGYLDDGTMVVCEQALAMIGQEIEATVTSVLQSSAGRMIFARPVGVEVPGGGDAPRDHRTRR